MTVKMFNCVTVANVIMYQASDEERREIIMLGLSAGVLL